jgi:hypothetical protein
MRPLSQKQDDPQPPVDHTQMLVRRLAGHLRAALRDWDELRAHLVHTGGTVPGNILRAHLSVMIHRRLEDLVIWDEAITATDPKKAREEFGD